MKINLEVIPHSEQRYITCGDWFIDNEGILQIRASDTGCKSYNFLLLKHELNEALTFLFRRSGGLNFLSKQAQEAADVFDIDYEKRRAPGEYGEPGYETLAPYYYEHMLASADEHATAALLHVNYNDYERALSRLGQDEQPSLSQGEEENEVPPLV